jgi:PTH1 family peptidyl-tRNA hydrolase
VLILLGQGNPGPQYAGNRHNIGFMAVDRIHADHGFGPWKVRFQSACAEGTMQTPSGSLRCLLMKPQTYYNETGRAAAEALKFYKLDLAAFTVIHDEIDLAPGRVRVKVGGGHSGNNGVRSITSHLGAEFRRVRLGVGHPGDKSQVMAYVLSDFPKADTPWRDALLGALSQALPLLLTGQDEAFQSEVLRLSPAPRSDPRRPSGPASGAPNS